MIGNADIFSSCHRAKAIANLGLIRGRFAVGPGSEDREREYNIMQTAVRINTSDLTRKPRSSLTSGNYVRAYITRVADVDKDARDDDGRVRGETSRQ